MKSFVLFFLISMACTMTYGHEFLKSEFSDELGDSEIVEDFTRQGVPELALKYVLKALKKYSKKEIVVQTFPQSYIKTKLNNTRYIGIADFSLPSNEKRFFLLDLETLQVETFHVTHAVKSGYLWAHEFSNEFNSKRTSLGLYLTGPGYISPAFGGQALKLFGLDETNYNAYARYIVLHQASYASEKFMKDLGNNSSYPKRLGRSFGCFAFSPSVAPYIVEKLKNGALIFAYSTVYEEDLLRKAKIIRAFLPPESFQDNGVDTKIELEQREPSRQEQLRLQYKDKTKILEKITKTK